MDSKITNRTERKKEETRKKIIQVAMDLFEKQGFDSTTMEQIALEADIAKGTLYNYFSVKEAIISAYIRGMIRERGPEVIRLMQQLPDTRSRLITVLRKSLEWIEVEFDNDLYRKYFAYRLQTMEQSLRNQSLRSGFNGILLHIIGLGQEVGEIRQDIPIEVLALQFEALHTFAVAAWLAIPEKLSIYENISWNVDLFLNGANNRGNIE